jgi:hypothetical protein
VLLSGQHIFMLLLLLLLLLLLALTAYTATQTSMQALWCHLISYFF